MIIIIIIISITIIILCSNFTMKFSFVSHSTKKELEEVNKRLEDMQENMMIK